MLPTRPALCARAPHAPHTPRALCTRTAHTPSRTPQVHLTHTPPPRQAASWCSTCGCAASSGTSTSTCPPTPPSTRPTSTAAPRWWTWTGTGAWRSWWAPAWATSTCWRRQVGGWRLAGAWCGGCYSCCCCSSCCCWGWCSALCLLGAGPGGGGPSWCFPARSPADAAPPAARRRLRAPRLAHPDGRGAGPAAGGRPQRRRLARGAGGRRARQRGAVQHPGRGDLGAPPAQHDQPGGRRVGGWGRAWTQAQGRARGGRVCGGPSRRALRLRLHRACLCGPRAQAATAGDVNGDGNLEVVLGTANGFIFALDGSTGEDIANFPFRWAAVWWWLRCGGAVVGAVDGRSRCCRLGEPGLCCTTALRAEPLRQQGSAGGARRY
jgi:hypothetical protein